MKKANFLKRLAALKSVLTEIKADTLWITQPENRRYFSGFKAVDDVDLGVNEGEVLGIVGESGSGKSVSQLALMGLIPFPGIVKANKLFFNNKV